MLSIGNAMSSAPIISGIRKLPNAPARIGMITMKIITVACIVNSIVYASGAICPPSAVYSNLPKIGMLDHGHANCFFVMGGDVAGGKVLGQWPGLAPEQLYENRDLQVTTDFREDNGALALCVEFVREPFLCARDDFGERFAMMRITVAVELREFGALLVYKGLIRPLVV